MGRYTRGFNSRMENCRIVNFYTSNYSKIVKPLKKSLNKFGYSVHMEELLPIGKWEENISIKPEYILKCLNQFNEDLLWIDADGVIERPIPIDEINRNYPNFYIMSWRAEESHWKLVHELVSATMYFPNNNESRDLLEEWVARQKQDRMIWDQRVLSEVLNSGKYEYEILPPEWCYIEKYHKNIVTNPIISQHQASRVMKEKINFEVDCDEFYPDKLPDIDDIDTSIIEN